jgi:hypothetical protein
MTKPKDPIGGFDVTVCSHVGIVPVTLEEAKAFVAKHHRHNKPPVSWKFGNGLEVNGELVGVAMAGRCVARPLDKRENIEITRVCVVNEKNGNSRLYGAILRAAKALGYKVAYTYTLQSESGESLRAVGFQIDAELAPRASWSCPSRPRMQVDLFGNETRPPEAKLRWIKRL